MRVPSRGPISLGVAVLGVFLVCGYALVQWTDHFNDGPDQPATPLTPKPGVTDLRNRGIMIEGGTFMSGSDDWDTVVAPGSPYSKRDEYPRRRTVNGFWMQEHEVTNEEYRRLDAGHEFSIGQERHPVVNVTWREATAYAAYVGGSLPTELQWEFAARGPERRKYPWGNSEPTCQRAHYRPCNPRRPIDVMARPEGATPEGIYDLAGNVSEWVVPIWFDPGRTPVNDDSRRLRGGSFLFAIDEFGSGGLAKSGISASLARQQGWLAPWQRSSAASPSESLPTRLRPIHAILRGRFRGR